MANEKRLIDANALWEGEFIEEENEYQRGWNDALRGAQHAAPTVDAVEVVHGRWVDNVDENGIQRNAWRKCSSCGSLNFKTRPNYCPNCGAKMDLK